MEIAQEGRVQSPHWVRFLSPEARSGPSAREAARRRTGTPPWSGDLRGRSRRSGRKRCPRRCVRCSRQAGRWSSRSDCATCRCHPHARWWNQTRHGSFLHRRRGRWWSRNGLGCSRVLLSDRWWSRNGLGPPHPPRYGRWWTRTSCVRSCAIRPRPGRSGAEPLGALSDSASAMSQACCSRLCR